MRARNIKPGFYANEDLAECSVWARLLAPGLWMLADRKGRLEDRPKRIKGKIFPFDNINVDELLNELDHWGHIKRYEVNGENFIQVLAFEEHQNPHVKEKPSEIPECVELDSGTCTRLAPDKPSTNTVLAPPDSLNPDSLNPPSEDKSSSGGAQPRNTKPRLEDFTLTDVSEWTTQHRPDLTGEVLANEFEKFQDHYRANGGKQSNGNPIKDWPATWRNWCRQGNFQSRGSPSQHRLPLEKPRMVNVKTL